MTARAKGERKIRFSLWRVFAVFGSFFGCCCSECERFFQFVSLI